MNKTNVPLEVQVGEYLRQDGLTVSVAESCTGGLIGDLITNIPGSSEYFLGGVIAYANSAKEDLLGVAHEILEQAGAVSEETAVEMARGVRRALGADIGISVTGIAGPSGATANKPVGLVWIGLSSIDVEKAYRFLFMGSRIENKASSAHEALKLLLEYLQNL